MSGATLDLWRRHLGEVPPEVLTRTDLATLILADNDLTALPPGLAGPTALRGAEARDGLLAGAVRAVETVGRHAARSGRAR